MPPRRKKRCHLQTLDDSPLPLLLKCTFPVIFSPRRALLAWRGIQLQLQLHLVSLESPLSGLMMLVDDPSTSADTEAVITLDVTSCLKVPFIPISSITLSIASHRRVSNAFAKSVVIHALRDVLLQLKDWVNSCANPIASVIRRPLMNIV